MSTERLSPEREAKLREARARALEVLGGPPSPIDEVLAELTAARDELREARAQLAALREAATALMDPETGFWSRSRATDFDAKVARGAALRAALSTAVANAQPTAEAYTRRVQAQALRRAAERIDHWADGEMYCWLRAEAERIEKGGEGGGGDQKA